MSTLSTDWTFHLMVLWGSLATIIFFKNSILLCFWRICCIASFPLWFVPWKNILVTVSLNIEYRCLSSLSLAEAILIPMFQYLYRHHQQGMGECNNVKGYIEGEEGGGGECRWMQVCISVTGDEMVRKDLVSESNQITHNKQKSSDNSP